MKPPFDVELLVQRHGGALRQLARVLVQDRGDADDLVQETWRRVVRSPARHADCLGGWLMAILRNAAHRWRRGEMRRLHHEQAVAARVEVPSEDPATLAARTEVAGRLLAALESLDAPYRETIWLRYFEGLAPREIASARAVPVATIKSRLQRGLGMLRERLTELGGADWRAGFATAFGLAREEAVVTASGASVAAGVVMATWMKVAALGAALVAAAVLWWPRGVGRAATEQASAHGGAPAVAGDAGSSSVLAGSVVAQSANDRNAVAPPAASVGGDPKLARMRGRCVDEQGQPLAGITARVSGRAWPEKAEQWELDHGAKPTWPEPPAVTTAADGVFVLAFVASPVFRYYFDLRGGESIPMTGEWQEIAEGARIDAGDVTMSIGARLGGRVVDASGGAVPKAKVALQAPGSLPSFVGASVIGRFGARRPEAGDTDRDGRFEFVHPLCAGVLDVLASNDLGTAAPLRVELRSGVRSEVVLAWQAHPRTNTITARIVDDSGRPVAAAVVRTIDGGRPQLLGSSARDGACTLRRREDMPAAGVRLTVTAVGFECLRTEPIAWGTRDIELRLTPGAALDVIAVDQHAQPIGEYAVRVMPVRATTVMTAVGTANGTWTSSEDAKIRARGPFADGIARVAGVATGKWYVLLEFPAASGLLPHFRTIEVNAAPQQLRVQVLPPVRRLVRVVSANGAPIAGTKVQLCDPIHGPLAARTHLFTACWQALHFQHGAVVVDEGLTDERGELTMRGPVDRTMALLISGPGHPVGRRPDVSFATSDPLVVEIDVGGRVEGRIEPGAVIGELQRKAATGVSIGFVAETGTERLPESDADPAFAIDQAGHFAVGGIPAGRWRVELRYRVPSPLGVAVQSVALGSIEVRANETSGFVGDAKQLLPGTLRGRVLANGAPLADTPVMFEGTCEGGTARVLNASNVTTDGEGRFELRDRAGTYRVRTAVYAPGAMPWYAVETATITVGETTQQTFSFFGGKLELRVIDADGKPAAAVSVKQFVDGVPDLVGEMVTGADGTCLRDVPAGTVRLRTLPKSYQSPQAAQKLWLQPGGPERVASLWIDLGTATIAAAQTTTLELRLPREWEK